MYINSLHITTSQIGHESQKLPVDLLQYLNPKALDAFSLFAFSLFAFSCWIWSPHDSEKTNLRSPPTIDSSRNAPDAIVPQYSMDI